MNILSISADRRLKDPVSPAAERQLAYARAFGSMTVLVRGMDTGIVRRAAALHRERPFDAVTSQDAFLTGLFAWRISRKLRIPWVAQVHTDVAAPAFRWQSWRTFLHWLCARVLLPRADRVRAVSERAAAGIRPWLPDASRLTVLPLAWRPDLSASEPREHFILLASRLTGEKRIGDALRAFTEVWKRVPGTTLRIAGDGPLRAELAALAERLGIADAVEFLGWREDVPALMRRAAVFVLCSSFEGYPRVVAEALAAGCPVVMTAVGGSGELVEDGISGRVVPIGDTAALAGAISDVLTDPARTTAYVAAGIRNVAALPDFPAYVTRFVSLFTELPRRDRTLFVTQVMDTADPVLGFTAEWVSALRRRVSSVQVIALRGRKGPGVHILRPKSAHRLVVALRYLGLLWRLRRSYDTVFVHMNQVYVLLGAPLLKLLGKRILLWRNHPQGTLATRAAVALSDRVFCTSERSFTARFTKTELMPVGIDTGHFSPGREASDGRRIAYVGRISPIKRVEILVEALGILRSRAVQFAVQVTGGALPQDEGYLRGLKARAHEMDVAIDWHPGVPPGRLPAVYRGAAVVVNLTPPGSFDKVILEALACGIPVIAANTDLRGKVDGRCLVDPADAGTVAARLEGFLELPATERAAIGAEGREFVVREHSLDALMDRLAQRLAGA